MMAWLMTTANLKWMRSSSHRLMPPLQPLKTNLLRRHPPRPRSHPAILFQNSMMLKTPRRWSKFCSRWVKNEAAMTTSRVRLQPSTKRLPWTHLVTWHGSTVACSSKPSKMLEGLVNPSRFALTSTRNMHRQRRTWPFCWSGLVTLRVHTTWQSVR